jgi:hypothetical protein
MAHRALPRLAASLFAAALMAMSWLPVVTVPAVADGVTLATLVKQSPTARKESLP